MPGHRVPLISSSLLPAPHPGRCYRSMHDRFTSACARAHSVRCARSGNGRSLARCWTQSRNDDRASGIHCTQHHMVTWCKSRVQSEGKGEARMWFVHYVRTTCWILLRCSLIGVDVLKQCLHSAKDMLFATKLMSREQIAYKNVFAQFSDY